jgi:hypothetical protein
MWKAVRPLEADDELEIQLHRRRHCAAREQQKTFSSLYSPESPTDRMQSRDHASRTTVATPWADGYDPLLQTHTPGQVL